MRKTADDRTHAAACRETAWSDPRALATAACLLLAGVPWPTAQKQDSRGAALQPASVSAASRHGYVPIEQLRVGDRVLAENPEHSAGEPASDTQVDPGTWRHLVLEADYRWPDGTPDPIRVETLQPPDWIAMQGAEVGQLVDLPLDLVEMGLPADLRARVLDNRFCPPLAPGPGRVVLTTVNHLHNQVVELQARDAHGRVETLRPTCFHKFYSQTRRAWVSAEDLQPREVLAGLRGLVTVASTAAFPGIHRVYNLTVEGEHVYCVGDATVTAHNNDCLPDFSPPNAKRRGAFREAKRQNEIPVSQQPSVVRPNIDRRGHPQPGRIYEFDTPEGKKLIRDDAGGHIYPDDPTQNRGPHFNDEASRHYGY